MIIWLFLHKPDHVNCTQNYVIFTRNKKCNFLHDIFILFFTITGLCKIVYKKLGVLYVPVSNTSQDDTRFSYRDRVTTNDMERLYNDDF